MLATSTTLYQPSAELLRTLCESGEKEHVLLVAKEGKTDKLVEISNDQLPSSIFSKQRRTGDKLVLAEKPKVALFLSLALVCS